MFYSCFNQDRGDYTVYEDDTVMAVNADLPVPALPPDTAGIGVPSLLAGRSLPSKAKPVGRSFNAKGILVRCDGGALGGFDAETVRQYGPWVVVGGIVIAIMWLTLRGKPAGGGRS